MRFLTGRGGVAASSDRTAAVALRAFLGIAVAASAVGYGLLLETDDRRLAVLPVAAVCAAALAALALRRFAVFVLLLLGLRSSIDLFKLSGASAGSTATNSVAVRGLDPSSLLALLFLVAAVLWLAAQHLEGRTRAGSALRTALVAFVVTAAISTLGSPRPVVSGLEVLRITSVAMMFVVLEQLVRRRADMVRVLLVAYAGMVVPLGYTLVGLVLGAPDSEVKGSFTRLTGPFSQSNTFARYLAFMIVFGIAVYPALNRRRRMLMALLLAVSTTFLVLTLTRGDLLACCAGVLVVALAQRRWGLLALLAVAAGAAVLLVPDLAARFSTLGDARAVGGPPTGNSLEWRLGYWSEVLPLAGGNPLTGIGLNMTQYLTDVAKQPHNDFLRAYVETGLLGLGSYVAVHVTMLRNGVGALRRSSAGTLEHGVAAGALGCAAAFFLDSLGANVMSNVVCLWYLVAFAAAASFVRSRSGALDGDRQPHPGEGAPPRPPSARLPTAALDAGPRGDER